MKRLFFLAAGMFAMGCEDYLFAGLLPEISETLRTSVVVCAQGCALFGLAYVLSMPLCAFSLAKWPARQVLIAALVIFMIGNALSLFATDFVIFFASRFLAGLGAGLYLPVAVATALQVVEPESRGKALSFMWGSNCAGAVLGVPAGLWLENKFCWQDSLVLICFLPCLPSWAS